MRAAVFLDRDGTIIEQVPHLTDPQRVALIPGAAEAIRTFQAMDYACVVVTNQSVIGRGLLTEEGLAEIHDEMNRQLAREGAWLDGLYYCSIAPSNSDRRLVEHPNRKPGPGMLLKAAEEMLLDVSRSWMVGDMTSDMLAGRNAGCRGTVLVRTGNGAKVPADGEEIDYVAADLLEASRLIARVDNLISAERNLV